ncbi:hypothetical protein LTR91_024275 [Friedmanniomyces endolithicus]|uniref:Zn(2)-C6 fungal-type domain-containing protein n=1 Tax=Friedmanniomyces endolithicus TaxID=329885 RepID=A0AAN6K0L3_9PEZI|nr:hypothetical protein LTR94_010444 [Friedmanniomyces endolithicus]KAK0785234.1 hypothetical protein LTR75_013606 [Friedmanniomyces endolithicus]KAK0793983.1 hypothetical protein LTR38_009392 [Friedmanniomyces endolithicus]KAK0806267.1 hypothetical protein LTR59_003680 [Friedmanniomyces endolithicus]KAK0841942.1 hypothetical protein LTR03_009574 [Friedmanniomyces endolithicus]
MPHLAPNSPELTSHALAPPVTMQGSQAPHFLPRVGTSPSNGPGRTEEVEAWSGEDDDEEGDGIDGPSRKRQRTGRPISVSCERCKERKVKCDRGLPSCGWCLRNEQICDYKERKKPGLRAGYGRELESRLDKLESVLQTQQHVIQQLANALPVQQSLSGAVQPPMDGQSQHVPSAETVPFMQTSNTYQNAASGDRYGSLHSQGSSEMVPQHHRLPHSHLAAPPPASDMYAPSDLPLESPSLNITAMTDPSLTSTNAPTMSAVSQDQDFPPYDLLYALTDLFFKHINTWCPILHRRTTLDALFGPSTLDEADRILLHAIVATTLRFSTDARLSEHSREGYHATSKQKVLLYGLENSSVKALQALVILTLDIVGSSNGPPGWNLLALITRSVVQLGLAVEATSASVAPLYPSIYTLRAMVLPEPKSFIEDESRRRLFWMVYLLDRYATISTAFEFALDDKEIDRKLPCRDDLFSRNQPVETRWFPTVERADYAMNKPENLGSFSYYIEIIGILSEIHRFLKKPVDIGALSDVEEWQQGYRQLDSKLNSWKFSLPSEYGNMSRVFNPNGGNKIVNCIWVMLHITYHTAVIRLHSSAAYPTTRSPIFTPSFSASQRCHAAVEDICALCTYVRNNSLLDKLGPPFAFSLWVAARLLLVHGSTIDHQVNGPAIYPLVETLREMGFYWKVAERYATLLSRVLEEYAESERAPVGANGVRETPSGVRILADMRRNAYDLDFLISRQPRQHFGAGKAAVATMGNSHITPTRTPAPNELEYLDVFDFFNMPRLPFPPVGSIDPALSGGGEVANGGGGADGTQGFSSVEGASTNNEFNITNFMFDANSDWFVKNQSG